MNLSPEGEYQEMLVRAKLSIDQIHNLMRELDLDPDSDSTWTTILNLAQWA